MTRARTPAVLAALILALGFAAMLGLNLPGQLSYDSVSQLSDARLGTYNSWHPAVMAWLLGLFDAAWRGTGLYVIFEALLLGAAFGLSLGRKAPWVMIPATLAIVLTPQFLLYQGIVWKDVLFADAMVLAFALLARAVHEHGALRPILLTLFFLDLALAALARQNGLLLLPVGAIVFGWTIARPGKRLLAALLALLLLASLVGSANLLLSRRGDHGQGLAGEIQLAQIYDLTGAARQGYRLGLLPKSDPMLASVIMTKGVNAYSLQLQDTLEPVLPARIIPGTVMAEWKHLIFTRPDLYLKERAAVFWQVLATPEIALCHPAYAGIDGDPAELKSLGLKSGFRPRDIRLAAYARGFMGTPVLSHLLFAALAAGLLVFFLRRGAPPDLAMAALLAGALLFAASFYFVSVACDYRYLLALDLAAMLGLFHAIARGAAD